MSATLIQPGLIEAKRLGFDSTNMFKAIIAVRMDLTGNLLQFELDFDNLYKITDLLVLLKCGCWEDITSQSVRVKRENDLYFIGHISNEEWLQLAKR